MKKRDEQTPGIAKGRQGLSREEAKEILSLDLSEELSDEQVKRLFPLLNNFNQIVYDFVIKYHQYLYRSRVYVGDQAQNMLEVHVIRDIGEKPGITAVELSKKWDRTPAFLSQVIKKLEEQGYIRRELSQRNRKYYHLYLSDKGLELDRAHQEYDVRSIIGTNQKLLKNFTLEQILSSREVLAAYGELIDKDE